MKDEFVKYTITLYQNIPLYMYEMLLFVFCIGLILMITFFGIKSGLRKSLGLILMEYALLLFSSTVLFREVNEKHGFELHPFWSYGREELIIQNVMNVAVFVPLGLLLGCAFRNMTWWSALMIGSGVSVTIEVLQYFNKRGFAETDDVMHNMLGSLIGYGLYAGTACFVRSIRMKKVVES